MPPPELFDFTRRNGWTQLASDTERQRMLWLDDHDGGQDVIMASALSKAITVQLGRNGWLQIDGGQINRRWDDYGVTLVEFFDAGGHNL